MIHKLCEKPSWGFVCLFSDYLCCSCSKVSLFGFFFNKTSHNDVLGVINTNNILLVWQNIILYSMMNIT